MMTPLWITSLMVATLTWFVATGVILWLDRRPADTYPASLLGATAAAGFAFAAILVTAEMGTAAAAWAGFFATIILWGWHEMSFLMGVVTGPRREPLATGARGWRRFRLATAALIHHEIALALTAFLLFIVTWGQPNQVAPLTFLLLFVMRLSTKLNIFLGVPHMAHEMMPAHLAYLKSYFGTRRRQLLMPLSLIGATALAAGLAMATTSAAPGSAHAATLTLLFALTLLALVEHLFLILPVRDSALWGWAMRQRS
jgi:putative photosynthetic complex assembly protein 2